MNKRTKALQIPLSVKKEVAQRDEIDGWTCCILCGSPSAASNAHYIPRSKSGLGIARNIVSLCQPCHTAFDQSERRREIGERIKAYLQSKYGESWNEDELKYKRA